MYTFSLYKKSLKVICSLVLTAVFVLFPIGQGVQYAQAGGVTGGATLGMQITQQAELAVSAVANSATAASTALSAGFNLQDFTKEFVLDNLAWTIAKQMVNQMTQSLLNWINSGFQGDPAFVTDLNSMLLGALDETAGEFISSLGEVGEFICSPFQLDVQAALSVNYAQARSGMPSGPTAPSCSLSDIGNNMENFLQGAGQGGLDEWLTITSNPQNTPYGAYLAAEASLNMRLQNAAGQEIELASWGDGFLSKKICQSIEGTSSENCTISTPGKVISEALTFQLSTGQRTLIEADEINEIIGALINQLVMQAVEGVGGLLGMTGGTGYTDFSYDPTSTSTIPFIDAAVNEDFGGATALIDSQINDALAIEQSFLNLIDDIATRTEIGIEALAIIAAERAAATSSQQYDPRNSTTTIQNGSTTVTVGSIAENYSEVSASELQAVQDEAVGYRAAVVEHLIILRDFKLRLEVEDIPLTDQQSIANDFLAEAAEGTFHTEQFVSQKRVEWNRVIQ